MTQDADHDPEFEAFLRRRSPMHRRLSQIDDAEPSAELDRIVLDRARDAIGAPSREPIYRKSRWAMPLALAATILLAFTVVLNIDHRRAASPTTVAGNANGRLAPAPAPVPQLMERAPAAEEGRSQREEQKRLAKAEAAPAVAAAAPALAAAAPSAEQPALADRAFASSPAEAERDDVAFPKSTDNATEIAAQRGRTLASSGSALARATGPTMPAPQEPAPSSASAQTADFRASPEAWLVEIKRLQAAGRNEEAERELAAFRKAHPAHPGYSLAQPPTR